MTKHTSTSWESSGQWYDQTVGEQGHYYHQTLIIPNLLKSFHFKDNQPASLLDLACGQGVLSRHLPSSVSYVGVDISPQLIASARQYSKQKSHQFLTGDATLPLPTSKKDFTHAAIILALQNIEDPLKVFKNAYDHLQPNASFAIVLNHPCFRIPRQSSWQVDSNNKIQYRRIDRYMSSMKIPIQTHPGKGKTSPQTWSFHHPLSAYSRWLHEAGFSVELIEEWCSNKVSEGKAAKMENRSREEIPLFMLLLARKKTF
ncbi:class I SAM-dependent DNA methyltransferase [Candidatus Protochlamydia phocaeensis]|uniref:class I SAM-dependent DNA methyltransferase n=1 Tax=Candidatus Protochlamydia phocaeensis TaxID=1414722 RepID=UPI0008387BD7|nr:class I SAM-dependent methyltransferase [Candidatus Protochlamydia phocaeensis]